MDGVIAICFAIEVYFVLTGFVLIFEGYCYYKDGNKKGTNLKGRALREGIRHELVHARIANKFGFTDWKIIHKPNSLACSINIEYDVLSWQLLFKIIRMCVVHFVYDIGVCIVWVDVVSICDHIKDYFSDFRRIINNFIEIKITNEFSKLV